MISREQAHKLNPIVSKTVSFQTINNIESILTFVEQKDLPKSLVDLIVDLIECARIYETTATDDPTNLH